MSIGQEPLFPEPVSCDSDFAVVHRSEYYIDKTRMIKDLLQKPSNETELILVTAPSRFGKTTILTMVKRSAEIIVNKDGTPHNTKGNANFLLFCQPKLRFNICKFSNFVKDNFGQHPVIYISYRRLKKVRNRDDCEEAFRLIIYDTFIEHKYLMQNDYLFNDPKEKQTFFKHCSVNGVKRLTLETVKKSFRWLSELLYLKFSRKVLILLDDYDAYFRGRLFDKISFSSDVVNYLNLVSRELLYVNPIIKMVLFTGILQLDELVAISTNVPIQKFRFLGKHKFNQYYGFTETEIDTITKRHIDSTRLNETRKFVDKSFNGYLTGRYKSKIYNMRSLLYYFKNGMEKDNYSRQSVEGLARLFSLDAVLNVTKKLIFSITICANISESLTQENLYKIKNVTQYPPSRYKEDCQWFTILLYDYGFLSVPEKNHSKPPYELVTIPNIDTYQDLSFILGEAYIKKYKLNLNHTERFRLAAESLRPNGTTMQDYKKFYLATNELLRNLKPKTETDIQALFLTCFQDPKFNIIRPNTFEVMTKFNKEESDPSTVGRKTSQDIYSGLKGNYKDLVINELSGRMEITVINPHGMVILMETMFHMLDTIYSMNDVANDALHKIYYSCSRGFVENPFEILRADFLYNAKGRRFIGIAYNMRDRNISIAMYNPDAPDGPVFLNSTYSKI